MPRLAAASALAPTTSTNPPHNPEQYVHPDINPLSRFLFAYVPAPVSESIATAGFPLHHIAAAAHDESNTNRRTNAIEHAHQTTMAIFANRNAHVNPTSLHRFFRLAAGTIIADAGAYGTDARSRQTPCYCIICNTHLRQTLRWTSIRAFNWDIDPWLQELTAPTPALQGNSFVNAFTLFDHLRDAYHNQECILHSGLLELYHQIHDEHLPSLRASQEWYAHYPQPQGSPSQGQRRDQERSQDQHQRQDHDRT